MKITDEAVEAAARSVHHEWYPWVVWENLKPESREYYRNEVRGPIEAALPHLTDDGATDTPPADMGVRSTQAAESATSVGAGAAAPSSPHLVAELLAYADRLDALSVHPTGTDPRAIVSATARDLREILASHSEGATPAIDREALARAVHHHFCIRRFEKNHDPRRSDYDKADEILEILALVGAPNSGASEDDR